MSEKVHGRPIDFFMVFNHWGNFLLDIHLCLILPPDSLWLLLSPLQKNFLPNPPNDKAGAFKGSALVTLLSESLILCPQEMNCTH